MRALNYVLHLAPFLVMFMLAGIYYVAYLLTKSQMFKNVAIGFDQTANAMYYGNPDQTVSGRLGRKIQDEDCLFCKCFCKILSFIFREKFHCINSIERDEV